MTATYNPEKFYGFKTLKGLLESQLKDIPYSRERVNRMFIGYVRTNIIALLSSNRDDKDSILNNIVSNEIWKELKEEYPASNLPLYARIVHQLICNKHKKILKTFIELIRVVKKYKCR